MKPLKKLNKLSRYLKTLKVGFVEAMLTTNASDATERLNGVSGVNIITSRPELHHSGNRDSLSAVVFVLDSRTGNLRRSRSTRASSDRLVFEHPIYERYLDMKRISGKKRKSRKIHNRYVFGAFSSIAERLMYGFTDEVAAQFREMSDKLGD